MKVNIWTVDIVLNNSIQVIQGAAAAGDRNNQDKTGFPNELKRWCFRTLAMISKEWGRTCTRVVVFFPSAQVPSFKQGLLEHSSNSES